MPVRLLVYQLMIGFNSALHLGITWKTCFNPFLRLSRIDDTPANSWDLVLSWYNSHHIIQKNRTAEYGTIDLDVTAIEHGWIMMLNPNLDQHIYYGYMGSDQSHIQVAVALPATSTCNNILQQAQWRLKIQKTCQFLFQCGLLKLKVLKQGLFSNIWLFIVYAYQSWLFPKQCTVRGPQFFLKRCSPLCHWRCPAF